MAQRGVKISIDAGKLNQLLANRINAAIQDVGDSVIVPEARKRVRVAKKHRSIYSWGIRNKTLKESIFFAAFKGKRNIVGEFSIGGALHASFPAMFVEKGTVKMKKKPFMRPATNKGKKPLMARLEGILP